VDSISSTDPKQRKGRILIQEKLTDFYDGPVRAYSVYACERAIPSGIDGLKPSQRKIIYGMIKLYPKEEIKVSIAAAAIISVTAFHHGSLEATMTKLAQSFPGSNNMPLLEGIGQFGSRLSPEPAASRYIFAKLTPVFGQMMLDDDMHILEHETDDGDVIEPKFYLPILPFVLINGADGMGTGYATHILQYDPKELKERAVARLNGKVVSTPLTPWYKGYNGLITRNSDGSVTIEGQLEVTNSTTITITELPIGKFTIEYRTVLNKLEADGVIKTYSDESNEMETKFVVKVPREVSSMSVDELKKMFKLVSKDTENLTVWDQNHKIRNFKDADSLLNWFVDYRLTRYGDRKSSMLLRYNSDLERLNAEIRFIETYLKYGQRWAKESTDEVTQELISLGFSDPGYFLGLRIGRLTGSQISRLRNEISVVEEKIKNLSEKTPTQLYLEDLKALKL
jgi:DNA topoisomerase-2